MWFPLHSHSHFSLLDGLSQPKKIVERIKECGYEGSAITDHGNISGCPPFLEAMKEAKLKPILGCEFYLCKDDASIKTPENRVLSHLCVLAKNLAGWKNLIKASSCSFLSANFYHKPRLNLEKLASFANDTFICFSGHLGSDLANICFENPKLAYSCTTYEEARTLVHPDWKNRVITTIQKYQSLFGKSNFYVEIQLVDSKNLPASIAVARILRHCAKLIGAPTVATADSHYPRKEDAPDQRILLCSSMETTLKEVNGKLQANEEVGLGGFFRSNNYHIPSLVEMQELHQGYPEELANSLEIASRCEIYNIGGKPILPQFQSGVSPDQKMYDLCKANWKKLTWASQSVYEERFQEEYTTLKDAGLSSYFLIVQDYIQYAEKVLKARVGKGRGSAAGCLIAYLLGITRVDPVRFGLVFSRFYNAARNTPGKIMLPDIDSDFAIAVREQVIDYIRAKYGHEYVAQMATFSRMQGRGAIKDVLRAHSRCDFEEMNEITEWIPDEAEIMDELKDMREDGGESSIIKWALENRADKLKKWCFIREDGELDGDLALDFAQAIRLEGTKRSMGKHASGIIIASEPLGDIVPMVRDKSSDELMVGVDMRDAEVLGLIKFDILGLRTLDCIMAAEKIIRGEI